jgi:ribosomal-protein-alanine N-acetyltransferase
MAVSDAYDMYEYASRSETSKYLLWSPHTSYSQTKLILRNIQNEYYKGDFFDFAVVLKENNKMIGTAGFTSFDAERSAAEIGYVLNPKYHGRGIATESLSVMMDFAFTVLGVKNVECRYLLGNDASLRVMQRCGMTHKGQCGRILVKGEYRDYAVCSITQEEYFAQKQGIIYSVNMHKGVFSRLFHKN